MTLKMKVPTLFGRERELAAVDDLVDSIRERGGTLVVRGEAGIGKSALLGEAGIRAMARGAQVLATTGVQSEAHLSFAGLHQLLRPCLAEIQELPAPQRDAISAAFGLTDATAPDVFLIALASLELLGEAAARSPLVLVVEDAHWLDGPSADVLAFVARRIELEPIVMLVAVREGFDDRFREVGQPELRLEGLGDDDAARVLDTNAPDLDSHLRTRVLTEAAGNPLALMELPLALRSEHPGDDLLLSEPLPLTARLERAFAARSSDLPESTKALLVVAATDDGGVLSEVLSAGSLLADTILTVDELAPAMSRGLVRVADGRVHFRHPLVRSAIFQAASVQERHAAHAALAEVLADAGDRGLWHRAASILDSDEGVSAELEEAAARALRRGAPAVAAGALERAARLTADNSRRGTLLLRAAEMEFELGRTDSSVRLLREAEPLELGAHERIRWSFLFEMFEHGSWSGASRVESFVEIANQMTADGDREHALEALLTVALRCWWGNPDDETRAAVVDAAERIGLPDDHPGLLAVLAFAHPVNRGAFVVERVSRATPDPADTTGALLIGSAAVAVCAHDLSLPFLEIAVEGLRAQGRLGLLAQALVTQAWAAVHLAREPLAVSAAEEAARLARETRQPRWEAAAVLAQATVAAERGDFDTAESLVQKAELILVPMGASSMLSLAQFVRGRGAVAHQRYSEGLEHLRRILDPADPVYQPFVGAWALSDLVEAAAVSGADELAREYLETLEALAEKTTGPLLQAEAGYARPLVADDDEAEPLYQAALERDLRNWPCYRGRMLLWYGRWLRRQRRVAESRAPLRAARDLFDALNFPELAESARQELRASGETSRRRVPEARDQLTPQELQIARMAAEGLSNREIGQRLYLSHRTVGSHLYRTFPKLGVTSRAQLSSVLADGDSQRREHALQSSD